MKSLIQTDNQFSGSVYIGDNVNDIHYLKGSIYIGDGGVSNYSKFDSTGKLTITGSGRVYNSIYMPVDSMRLDSITPPTPVVYNGVAYLNFAPTATEYAYYNFVLPHDYAEGTDIISYLYILNPTVAVGIVNFQLNYKWNNINASIGSATPLDIEYPISVSDRYFRAESSVISGIGKGIGSIFSGVLNRGGGGDEFADVVYLLGIGVNYLVDGFGSTNRFTK